MQGNNSLYILIIGLQLCCFWGLFGLGEMKHYVISDLQSPVWKLCTKLFCFNTVIVIYNERKKKLSWILFWNFSLLIQTNPMWTNSLFKFTIEYFNLEKYNANSSWAVSLFVYQWLRDYYWLDNLHWSYSGHSSSWASIPLL